MRVLTIPLIVLIMAVFAGVVTLVAAPAPKTVAPAEWPTLSRIDADKLLASLRGRGTGSITIACASTSCSALGNSLAGVFVRAGWRVTRIEHGGLGIDGVRGLRVSACGLDVLSMRNSLVTALGRRVEAVDEGDCGDGGTNELFLVIGASG